LKSTNIFIGVAFASACVLGANGPSPCWAQGGTDRAIFQEEQQMMQTNQNQVQQLERQRDEYQQEVGREEQQNEPYRLYAEKRIQELNRLKAAGGSPTRSLAAQKGSGEFYALEKWLSADAQARAEEQARLKQLDQAIVNLQTSQTTTIANMNADIQSMREDSQRSAENQKFQQQMQINQFNELQSEMGAASWGRPPTDGTFNSVGGYGFGGGYGYGFGGGRRTGW
jgi:hypothetical protein